MDGDNSDANVRDGSLDEDIRLLIIFINNTYY